MGRMDWLLFRLRKITKIAAESSDPSPPDERHGRVIPRWPLKHQATLSAAAAAAAAGARTAGRAQRGSGLAHQARGYMLQRRLLHLVGGPAAGALQSNSCSEELRQLKCRGYEAVTRMWG